MSTANTKRSESMSLATRSIASESSSKGSVRRRAEIAKLKARQAVERARVKADIAKRQAEAEAQECIDVAELLELEASLEENGNDGKSSKTDLVDCSMAQQRTRQWVDETSRSASDGMNDERCRHEGRPSESVSRPMDKVVQPGIQPELTGGVAEQAEMVSARHICCAKNLQPIKLNKFGGSSLEWPLWSSLFKTLVDENDQLTDSEKMIHLQTSLTGKAKEVVQGMLCNGLLYRVALEKLERQFGNARDVVKSAMTELLSLPPVRDHDLDGLARLSSCLQNTVSVLRAMGYGADLAATSNMDCVVRKLPVSISWQWGLEVTCMEPSVPSLAELSDWLERYVRAGTIVHSQNERSFRTSHLERGRPDSHRVRIRPSQTAAAVTAGSDEECGVCEQAHAVEDCPSFECLSADERARLVREKSLCFRCLRAGHLSRQCDQASKCKHCKQPHHYMLHGCQRVFPARAACNAEPDPRQRLEGHLSIALAQAHRDTVLLQVVPVVISGPRGRMEVNALLDLGSQISLVTEDVASQLGITGPVETLRLGNINDTQVYPSQRVTFDIVPVHAEEQLPFTVTNAMTTTHLNVSGYAMNWPQERAKWKHLKDLDLPVVKTSIVSVLLGVDCFSLIVPREVREGKQGTPSAVRTKLGWTVTSSVPSSCAPGNDETLNVCHVSRQERADDALHQLVKDWWSTDSFGTTATVSRSQAEQKALAALDANTKWVGCRYQTGLLWKSEDICLPDNRQTAEARLRSTERKLDRDTKLAAEYCATVRGYIEDGVAKKLTAEECQQQDTARRWFLPHHAVINPQKPKKVRVVFDAAAKHNGVSLNDALLTGPDQLNSLQGILMRFRERPVAVTADIRAMFHQIQVRPSDRAALQFLWRGMERDKPPSVYQMQSLIFGASCSPSCATYVLRRCADDQAALFPEAAAAVRSSFYVDDYVDSLESEEEAMKMQKELTEILKSGGFSLTKWNSSSQKVLDQISKEHLNSEVLDLALVESTTDRTLGAQWNFSTDNFTFKTTQLSKPLTKRGILSMSSTVFDPLGLLAPFVLKAKWLIQELWKRNYSWDEDIIDADIVSTWTEWAEDTKKLDEMHVPRCYRPDFRKPVECQLHVFADASEIAFGMVAYFRLKFNNGNIHCCFVTAKNRVAPLRQLSIPRLELQAAVMAVRVAELIKKEHSILINSVHFWTDSQTVLRWINSQSRRYHTFVANRISEIQESSDEKDWRYCPSAMNAADVCSRGSGIADLLQDRSWLQGPDFLWKSEDAWPALASNDPGTVATDDKEVKVVACCTGPERESKAFIEPARFSSWLRLIRVTAWVRRFVANCRKARSNRLLSTLSLEELNEAEWFWLRRAQDDGFPEEKDALSRRRNIPARSRILQLKPYIDEQQLLRVGGRLDRAALSYSATHQVILPSTHDVTRLIITDRHQRLAHSGPEHVLASLRQQYWVLHGRSAVKS